MTPLQQQLIRELELQRRSKHTITAYTAAVRHLAKHFNRAPDKISQEEVRSYINYLVVDRCEFNHRAASVNR